MQAENTPLSLQILRQRCSTGGNVSKVHGSREEKIWYVYIPGVQTITLTETNIAPARKLPQKETNLPTIQFQVLC